MRLRFRTALTLPGLVALAIVLASGATVAQAAAGAVTIGPDLFSST